MKPIASLKRLRLDEIQSKKALECVNKLPIHNAKIFNYFQRFTSEKWSQVPNFTMAKKMEGSWRKPFFNLKRQRKFIEYTESIGVDPRNLIPGLRTLNWKKAPFPLDLSNKKVKTITSNEELEKLKIKAKAKRRAASKFETSPLDTRTSN
eukprot:NODE_85_length_22232_cov_1.318619.p21 type:complete len:150 gc:universal NODE_85_length_22232_cov_1.318619:10561-10112(-)